MKCRSAVLTAALAFALSSSASAQTLPTQPTQPTMPTIETLPTQPDQLQDSSVGMGQNQERTIQDRQERQLIERSEEKRDRGTSREGTKSGEPAAIPSTKDSR